jgi:CheY-like chemotaxis protein
MKIALKNSSANYFRKFKRLQLTFQVVKDKVMDMFAHTDAAYLIADSILGELTFVRQALEAAGCERVYASGDEAEALALIERERIDLVLVAWDAFHDGLELLHALRRMPEHRQLPVCFILEAAVDPERVARLHETGDRLLGYGVKPLSPGALLHAIGELFDKLSNL